MFDQGDLETLLELGSLALSDTLALGAHLPFRHATADVIVDDGHVLIERIKTAASVPSFPVPGDIRLGMTAASRVAHKLDQLLVATGRGRLGKHLVCERDELGACSIDVGSSGVITCGAELGREQTVNRVFMDVVAEQLRRGNAAQLRLQHHITGGEPGPHEFKFDGPNERLHFVHGPRRTSRRGYWLGQYNEPQMAFRWIWDVDEAPEYVRRGASLLPGFARKPGYGALRLGTFVAHPTFVTQALHVAAELVGASTIYSFAMDPMNRGYFAIFED